MTTPSADVFRALVSLVSRFRDKGERDTLLIEAFYPDAMWMLDHIELEGTPRKFAVHCVRTIGERDCRMLNRLLDTLDGWVGDDIQTDIVKLRPMLPAYCQQLKPSAPSPNTPAPTLFINHATADTPFAQQLRTDLETHGYICHLSADQRIDTPNWEQTLQTHINQAQRLITILSPAAIRDLTLQQLYIFAHTKATPKKSILLTAADTPIPPHMQTADQPLIPCHTDYPSALTTLLTHLPQTTPQPQPAAPAPTLTPITDQTAQQRAAEKAYLDRLKLRELRHTSRYTPLSGKSHIRRTAEGELKVEPVVARNEFKHLRRIGGQGEPAVETKRFEDAVPQLKEIRRAVLLGDPGAGKTTTLFKLAADLAHTTREAPLPLLFRLGDWREKDESLLDFLRRQLGGLGAYLDDLLNRERAVLLLDGLNEIPAGQQRRKYGEVKQFLTHHQTLMAIVTCRTEDYKAVDLTLDRVEVAPLDPLRIREYVRNYLDMEKGETLFWKLAGEQAQARWEDFLKQIAPKLDEPEQTFWLKPTLPRGLEWGYKNRTWENWLKEREHPAGLLLLATNPYMLFMIVEVYVANQEQLPPNRGELFDRFVETLLLREGLYVPDELSGAITATPAGATLFNQLLHVAEAMQNIRQRGGAEDALALTTLSLSEVSRYLDEQQRYQAASANILTIGDDVRFSHQLLQEYFAARALQMRVFGEGDEPQMDATTIWHPDNWWEPTNWEETAILLAGLYSDDCTPVLRWLVEAQPELAARCVVESGADTPESTLLELREKWFPRLTDLKRDPDARARAAVGRALGRIRLADGTLLDNRVGVGVVEKEGLLLPDIVWGEAVPAGRYSIGGDTQAYGSFNRQEITIKEVFQLSRYQITYAQFQCFIEAPDVHDPRWWADLPQDEQQFREQSYKFWNSPRETVSWYQATAFCRWLSAKLGYEIALPHEYEWEVAAHYPHQKAYPWGDQFDSTKANTREGDRVGRTTAVGLYPNGRNKALNLHDMSGNIFEWCANKHGTPEDDTVDSTGDVRVLRGGSFNNYLDDARVAYRFYNLPSLRNLVVGLRLVCRRPPSQRTLSAGPSVER